MKTTSKILLAAIALFIINSSSVSAKSHGSDDGRFSAGVEVALPMGTFGDNAGTGFGASLRYEMPMGDNLALMGTAGYITYGSKTVDLGPFGSFKYTNSIIPIQVGAKYYFTEQQNGFYGEVQLGVHLLTAKTEVTVPGIPTVSNSGSSTAFSYAPGVGYHLANLDFALRYQLFSESTTTDVFGTSVTTTTTASYLGIRAAYVFGGK